MRRSAALLIAFLVLAAPPARAAETSVSMTPPFVRVLVLENQKSVAVTIKGEYVVRALPSLKIVKKGRGLVAYSVAGTSGGIRLGREEWAERGLRFEPAGDRDLYLFKARYRGSMDILKDAGGSLYAVNRLGVEGYLYGVLHYEVSAWWPMEALKAQAVAARSYALYQAKVSTRAEYDLKSGTSSQVYGGSTSERYRSRLAVDQTRGQVLSSDGKVFPAYFHATCGGRTAAASELWKIDIPPLAGGVRCGYCKISPHFGWRADVPLSEIEEMLTQYGKPLGQILSIRIISQTPSGRVGSLQITGNRGATVVAAKDFRIWIGGNRMKSTNYTMRVSEDTAKFEGSGWGHGVGLCQWGAFGQSLLGRKFTEILDFYYPNSQIRGIHELS